jgi:hypothetical protein
MEKLNLHSGNPKDGRRDLDYYPTPPEVTHALMRFLDLPDHFEVWEPACGEGYMSDVIANYCKCVATDITDGIDFLETQHNCDAIITNPPFALSEKFILHALSSANIVAMLLKSQYWHAKKRHGLFIDTKPSWVLPLTWRPDFLFNTRKDGVKASPTMEVAWTVWIKGDDVCKYHPLSKENSLL